MRAGRGVGARREVGTGPAREEVPMTRNQVSHLIAARTGESLAVIRRLGFQIKSEPREEPVAEEIRLVVPLPVLPRTGPLSRPVPRRLGRPGRVRRLRRLLPLRGRRRLPGQRRDGSPSPRPARRRYIPA